MTCYSCGGDFEKIITDLPFKIRNSSIVIIRRLPVLQCKNFNEYVNDPKTKAACERYFEKIIEAVVDLAFLIIKEQGLKLPEEEKEAFDILALEKIIDKELAEKLKDAKGMRNIMCACLCDNRWCNTF